ncbi:MAG: ferrous iron transport protein A [Bryobacterales bacterium]|nr:ferrous iron transport protein A [Bryobacterales bacterium]
MGVMQVDFNSKGVLKALLSELREGQQAVLESLDLPEDIAMRLMELGFLPGQAIRACQSAPGGDPRIFRIDGSQIALRRETTSRIQVRVAS